MTIKIISQIILPLSELEGRRRAARIVFLLAQLFHIQLICLTRDVHCIQIEHSSILLRRRKKTQLNL